LFDGFANHLDPVELTNFSSKASKATFLYDDRES